MEGLLLAAGAGRRMGTPKALVSDDRGSWLQRGIANLRQGGCARVTVVLGAEAEQAEALLAGAPDETRVIMLSLVDLPDLVPEVVARVGRAARSPHVLARAAYDGVPGHPVLLGRDHWPGVLESAQGDQGARSYLARHDVELIECGDLATGRDVDSLP